MQNQDSVSMYFSKLKTLLDELMNYESIPNCTCGGLKTVVSNQERDWVMKFLMGLNDSFKGIKAQILLIKHFPSLNEVYSLIQQEEKRRHISLDVPTAETMALMGCFAPREAGRQKMCFKANLEKPVCSHCHIPGHTAEKCFKIHGYPSGHKQYGKPRAAAAANQASTLMTTDQEQTNNNSQVSLTQEQYGQLMALLQTQNTHSANHVQTLISSSSKPFDLENDWSG
ncbi:hypothetical protein I3843_08G048800 [Carya illinoinensis]|nr:hypothetical protein I3843_08G048800 [Carya illinoinensis]